MLTSIGERPNSSASEFLVQNVDRIMQQWEVVVRDEIPAAYVLDSSDLRNSLPDFIKGISSFISTTMQTEGGERYSDEVLKEARDHGTKRAERSEYTLDQVIIEYRILRRTILRELEEVVDLSAKEREKLLEAIDIGLVQAATEFASLRGFQAARLRNAETQAYEAKKKLTASHRRVDELEVERSLRQRFVATLTHDLRTPLTAVKACADLIVKQAENVDIVRKLAVKISEGSERLSRMIKDLLDANQIEAGKPINLRIEFCNLEILVQEVLESLSTVYGDRFSLSVKGDQKGFWSPEDLRRVVENLVINGLKYGESLGKVTINLHGTSENISIAVHNEGNPISPEQQSILFQPYKRLRSAQIGGKSGWGLGLTLVRGIIEAHSGNVSVASAPYRGTTFTVILPRDSRSLLSHEVA